MAKKFSAVIVFASIAVLVLPGISFAFDTAVIDWAIKELCDHITGSLGGLLVSVAALGAIVAAAMGSYRVFYSAIMTAVGAFAISSIVSLYFEDAAGICSGGGGGGATRVAATAETRPAAVNADASQRAVGDTGLGE